jgi:hypothetical protein
VEAGMKARGPGFFGKARLTLLGLFSLPILLAQEPSAPESPSRQIQAWSSWTQTLVEKRDPVSAQRSFTWDDRFEYRWKPEWTGSGYACTVEIRPAGDEDLRYQLSEIDVLYQAPDRQFAAADTPLIRRKPQLHDFTTSNVTVRNRQAHATLKAGDCGAVVAVTAGRFSPEIPIPVQVTPLQ